MPCSTNWSRKSEVPAFSPSARVVHPGEWGLLVRGTFVRVKKPLSIGIGARDGSDYYALIPFLSRMRTPDTDWVAVALYGPAAQSTLPLATDRPRANTPLIAWLDIRGSPATARLQARLIPNKRRDGLQQLQPVGCGLVPLPAADAPFAVLPAIIGAASAREDSAPHPGQAIDCRNESCIERNAVNGPQDGQV